MGSTFILQNFLGLTLFFLSFLILNSYSIQSEVSLNPLNFLRCFPERCAICVAYPTGGFCRICCFDPPCLTTACTGGKEGVLDEKYCAAGLGIERAKPPRCRSAVEREDEKRTIAALEECNNGGLSMISFCAAK